MQDRRRREVHTDRFTLLLLLGQLWQHIEQLPYKPVVTLGLMAFQIVAHMEPAAIPFLNHNLSSICLDPAAVSYSLAIADYGHALLRLWGSAFVHVNDYHLYYNMASLLYKGGSLETALGSGPFGCLCIMMLVLAHGFMLLTWGLATSLGLGSTFGHHCFTGFSAVLFAFKYIVYDNHEGQVRVYFFSVAAKYATWVELIIMYAIAPTNSIVCHVCGIAAGAVVVHFPHLVPYELAWVYLQHYGKRNDDFFTFVRAKYESVVIFNMVYFFVLLRISSRSHVWWSPRKLRWSFWRRDTASSSPLRISRRCHRNASTPFSSHSATGKRN
jgi:membrane associated rhomboid family serine protease